MEEEGQRRERHFVLQVSNRNALSRTNFIPGPSEEGTEVTQAYKEARSNEYATRSDFCRIYVEQMNSLYLLSLLLTADPQKAEQCFLSGFDDCLNNNSVFKERAYLWARRSIILRAIQLLGPRPTDENESNEARLSPPIEKVPAQVHAHPTLVGIVRLNSFERFVFIMSVLEMYSQQECCLLLRCFRSDVINARTAAMRSLASTITTEAEPERDVIAFAEANTQIVSVASASS
jgi:hypothetical protein